MAEKKINEEIKETKLNKEAAVLPEVTYNDADEYNVDAFGETKIASNIEDEKEFVTKYPIQCANENGKVYFAVAFLVSIGGKKIPQRFRLKGKGGGKDANKTVQDVLDAPGAHNLEVVKRCIRDSNTNRSSVFYSIQTSCVTDEGFKMVAPLEPSFPSDKAIWENLKRQLIARGDIE